MDQYEAGIKGRGIVAIDGGELMNTAMNEIVVRMGVKVEIEDLLALPVEQRQAIMVGLADVLSNVDAPSSIENVQKPETAPQDQDTITVDKSLTTVGLTN